jgi:hypothetical protein
VILHTTHIPYMWRLLERLLQLIKPGYGKGDKLLACVPTLGKINMPKVNRPQLKKLNKLHGFSPQAKYTDRVTATMSVKLMPTFADRGCSVVSATDPHDRQSRFSRPRAATFPFK